MSLSTTIKATITAIQTLALDLVTPKSTLQKALEFVFANGTGLNQANVIWSDKRTLAASANEDLDLAAALVDSLGQAAVFARVKAIIVKASSTNTNNVNVSRPAANGVPVFLAAGDGLPVVPNGAFIWIAPTAAGVAVTAGTGDLLNIANSGAGSSVEYEIIVLGASS